MKLTPEQMVSPRAIAPFEVQYAFREWALRMEREAQATGTSIEQAAIEGDLIVTAASCGGLGPPWPLLGERPVDFGERCAVALFTLYKEA